MFWLQAMPWKTGSSCPGSSGENVRSSIWPSIKYWRDTNRNIDGTSVVFSSSYLLNNVQPRVVHREPKEELAVRSRYSCFRKPSATAASAVSPMNTDNILVRCTRTSCWHLLKWSFSRVSDTIQALISPPKPDWTENAVGDLLDSGP